MILEIARILPKDMHHKILVLVTPKPSQLTIRWKVSRINETAVQLVNVQTGQEHTESWKNVRQWIRKGQLRYDLA